jgi:histone deacetylase 1/2
MTTRAQHGIFKPRKLFNLYTSTHQSISPLPTNPIDALNDQNWKMAMKDEYDALIENKTWELVPRPSNANVIRSLWIFRHKKKSDGSFERYKARLVGNDANQQSGVDCGEPCRQAGHYPHGTQHCIIQVMVAPSTICQECIFAWKP